MVLRAGLAGVKKRILTPPRFEILPEQTVAQSLYPLSCTALILIIMSGCLSDQH